MSGDAEFNPFEDEAGPRLATPCEDDDADLYTNVNGNIVNGNTTIADGAPILDVLDSNQINGHSSYTSLDSQHESDSRKQSDSDMEDNILQPYLSQPLSETVDLFVKVDSPEKHVEGYVSYSVNTQTTRTEFELSEYKVRRRYQDFLWLRQKLGESHPSHIIPPLPEKFTFSKHMTFKFDPDFLKTRQKALDKFLARIVDHPVMSFNEHFRTFLTAKAWEMTTVRKDVSGAMSKMSGSMKNTATQLMMKNRCQEFTDMVTYNNQFQSKIKNLAAIGDNIAQDRCYMLEDYAEYATAFRLWSNSESNLADTLNAVSEAVDKQSENLKGILRAHELRICEPLREYILYSDAVRTTLKRRDQIQMEHELASDDLQKRRQEKDEVETAQQTKSIQTFFGKDPEEVRREKLNKLTQQISDLVAESEVLSDSRATADQDIRADMERWQLNKNRDLKALLVEIAERHIQYYQGNIDGWEDALDIVKKPTKASVSE